MPLYEYRCTSCGYSFEKIQNYSANPETECPKCGGELIRPVTAPALRFEGAGWYVNDYAAKGGAKAGESAEAKGGDTSSGKDQKTETKSDSGGGSDKAGASGAPAPPAASTPSSTTSSTPSSTPAS